MKNGVQKNNNVSWDSVHAWYVCVSDRYVEQSPVRVCVNDMK